MRPPTPPAARAAGVAAAAGPGPRVMVIDDEDVMLMSCQRILAQAGYQVEAFGNGHDGIRRLAEVPTQVLFVDLKMPELDGFQVISRVRTLDEDVVIVVITGYATIDTAVEAMKAGAHDFLPKPFTPDELRLIAARASERHRLVVEARRLRREKEDAERRFVTFVSHQLKTPLVAAKQYLDVLLYTSRDQLPETAVAWIGRSQARLGEMLAIIGDWLTLARVERGALIDGAATVDAAALVEQVLQAARPQADAASVTLEADLPGPVPGVRGDAAAVGTLLSNLVGNAVKYNRPGGRVTVRVRRDDRQAVVTVTDTGIGIEPDSLPQLFGEFYRAPAARDIPGTGLGLAICRRIVTELGGTIDAEGAPGVGATFTVRLPMEEASGASPGSPR